MSPAFRAVLLGCLVTLACPVPAPVAATEPVGFRRAHLPPSIDGRALDVAVWYPTDEVGTPTIVGENRVFVGQPVLTDADPAPGRHPLVVLSHGYGGNWRNQAWLAVALAGRGHVVAAVDHPGTTTFDMDATTGAQLWERPRDLSRVIDLLSNDPAWSGVVTVADGVAVIGHSLGGWTAVAIAGGRFDPSRLETDCQQHARLSACSVYDDIAAGRGVAFEEALGQELRDPRVAAIVTLDIGLARGFDPGSLGHVDVPALVVAAGAAVPGIHIPAALESSYLLEFLPPATTRYLEIATAAHLSFLPICKPDGLALLEQEGPAEVVACLDAEGGDREAAHAVTTAEVIRFLTAERDARRRAR